MVSIKESFRVHFIQYRAARSIQSYVRMMLAKKKTQLLVMRNSSIIIQKKWRSRQIQVAYQIVRQAVTSVQSLWGAHCCRRRFQETRSKIINVQSTARRFIVYVRLSRALVQNFGMRSFFRQYLQWRGDLQNHYVGYHRDEARVKVRLLLVV